jgi:hypothetical protein
VKSGETALVVHSEDGFDVEVGGKEIRMDGVNRIE